MGSIPGLPRAAVLDAFLATPEDVLAEIVDGDLVTQPRPGPAHTRAASSLGGELHGPFNRGKGGPGGWIILDEPELHLRADILVPDLAGWRRERMPELPKTSAFEVVPDWVCEVLSPGTAARDRTAKRRIYGRERVRHLWFVDPAEKTLEVFRLHEVGWTLVGAWSEDARVRPEPFEAFELELGALWEG